MTLDLPNPFLFESASSRADEPASATTPPAAGVGSPSLQHLIDRGFDMYAFVLEIEGPAFLSAPSQDYLKAVERA